MRVRKGYYEKRFQVDFNFGEIPRYKFISDI